MKRINLLSRHTTRRLTLLALLGAATLCTRGEGFALRLLNHWDNPDGTVERGYAGRSIWKWDDIPANPHKALPDSLRTRWEEYGRLNREFGINGTVLNNVNAKPVALAPDMLRKTARIADVLRPYGIRVYLSVNFASPKALGGLPTADPLDDGVRRWWQRKADEIYRLIPDFGGFLVKANSEGEPGPMDYGRTHADGANLLAGALRTHGGIVMWRAFVYSAKGGDRASQAYDEFIGLDGQFSDNVIIQIKNGPIDFQPREAVSPLFFGLKKTKTMAEFQITQEYTGESIHTCFLAPMWHEFFAALATPRQASRADTGAHSATALPQGTPLPPNLVGLAGVANIGDSPNFTANDLALANWYAFGRLAADPATPSRTVAEDFLRRFYTTDERFVLPVAQLLLRSREALVDYMMPLGLHHIFAADHHYGPEPWCDREGWREDWLPRFYHRADSVGLGFNRTDHAEPCAAPADGGGGGVVMGAGSGNVAQYPEPLRSLYNDLYTCPEELLLWFHHVPWDHTMRNGLSLWENLCYAYDRGVAQAEAFVRTWESVRPCFAVAASPSAADTRSTAERYEEQLRRFRRQARDARWWRDACLLYFGQFSRRPLPPDCPAPVFTLEELMRYRLDMDNCTAADMECLP